MKIRKNNKGYTFIEAVVSLGILCALVHNFYMIYGALNLARVQNQSKLNVLILAMDKTKETEAIAPQTYQSITSEVQILSSDHITYNWSKFEVNDKVYIFKKYIKRSD